MTNKRIIITADTLDELMHVDESNPELSVALGPVILERGRYRWGVVISASQLPPRAPGDDTYGVMLYHNINTAAAESIAGKVAVEGWMMSGTASVANLTSLDEAEAGRLAEHPRAEHGTTSFYLDQVTGTLTFRTTTKTSSSEYFKFQPAGGWDIDKHGAVPALLDRFRLAYIRGAHPLFRNHSPQ